MSIIKMTVTPTVMISDFELTQFRVPTGEITEESIDYALRIIRTGITSLQAGWDMAVQNSCQRAKLYLTDVKMTYATEHPDEYRELHPMIQDALEMFDSYADEMQKDWVRAGYNPPKKVRRTGKRLL